MEFEIPTQPEADTYARYLVRLEEMRQSHRIINQCLDGLPEGPVMAKLPKILRAEVNEVYHPTECPKGELGYYLVGEKGSTNPYRFHVRAPGLHQPPGPAHDDRRQPGGRRHRHHRHPGRGAGRDRPMMTPCGP